MPAVNLTTTENDPGRYHQGIDGGPTDTDLLVFGYAYGLYISKCKSCSQQNLMVQKHCRICRPCAVLLWKAARTATDIHTGTARVNFDSGVAGGLRVATAALTWSDWMARPVFRSWDKSLEMRKAETPFGPYFLLRRHCPNNRDLHDGKWFVQRPGAFGVGPFDDDVTATRAADEDFEERVKACLNIISEDQIHG